MFISNVFWHMQEIVFDNGFRSYFLILLWYCLCGILLQLRDLLLSYVYSFVSVCCDCVHLGLYILINMLYINLK